MEPEVAVGETMTHEAVRTDHIGVMLEVYPNSRQNNAIIEKYIVNKADYTLWNACTEVIFKLWNEKSTQLSR